jgi:Domain of unknown function (DUF3291)
MHLAELNVARMLYPLDDPRMADFANALDHVNAVAERSEGFVWRLKGESAANQDQIDPLLLLNLTVWESPETLEKYVWQTVHKRIYNQKGKWFEPPIQAHFVMWPIEQGCIPALEEAFARLEHLRTNGSSDYAYGWEGLPHLKVWMAQQCG